MNKGEALKKFFSRILVGETKSYNDYGYYVCSGSTKDCYRSYIEGSSKYNKKYPLLSNPLETYSIKYIMDCQAKAKDSSTGQLFGVGRYAIIPATLKELVTQIGIDVNLKFTPDVQDKFGLALLTPSYRKYLRKFILAEIEDNQENLERAALETAQIWSSLGIPYDVTMTYQGKVYYPKKNQSYYPFDKATVPASTVMGALKDLRRDLNSPPEAGSNYTTSLFFLALLAGGYYLSKK
jgi:hypothetical protein